MRPLSRSCSNRTTTREFQKRNRRNLREVHTTSTAQLRTIPHKSATCRTAFTPNPPTAPPPSSARGARSLAGPRACLTICRGHVLAGRAAQQPRKRLTFRAIGSISQRGGLFLRPCPASCPGRADFCVTSTGTGSRGYPASPVSRGTRLWQKRHTGGVGGQFARALKWVLPRGADFSRTALSLQRRFMSKCATGSSSGSDRRPAVQLVDPPGVGATRTASQPGTASMATATAVTRARIASATRPAVE